MKRYLMIVVSTLIMIVACKKKDARVDLKSPKEIAYASDTLKLSEAERYDKILGALVGSAIGDAMGVSTEMWHRNDIRLKYGYINGIPAAVMPRSSEGIWGSNLMAGATTDDTRWKYLTVNYLLAHKKDKGPATFAKYIVDYYTDLVKSLGDKDMQSNPDVLDSEIEKVNWIKEWARVAIAYNKSPEDYQKAQNRFYGGEMSCAGQLYTPLFGLVTDTPEEAYKMAYEHALFDLGYAKDISGLVAAMTQMAMRTQNMDSIINTVTFVDPYHYQDSRLVGRIVYKTANTAVKKVLALKESMLVDSLTTKDSLAFNMPKGFKGTQKDWMLQESLYRFLENDKKAIAFHAGEIWQILITALQFGEGDFTKNLQFIVNYGRDNDTVGAVAGMILGARDGYSNLPKDLKEEIVKVSRENMGIDLEVLAREILIINRS